MEIRAKSLGWAGVELTAGGASIVIDPLADPAAVFAPLGDAADAISQPEVTAAGAGAVAGLLTHLHRDHADAGALTASLAPGAPVLEPGTGGGEGLEELGLAQADQELDAAGIDRRRVTVWERTEIGPFAVTALPAADGTGDPQVSWLVESGETRIVHLGDTMFHGWWWRIALRAGGIDAAFVPINGAILDFPHRRPASPIPGVMDPAQAAEAVRLLGARVAVPMHYGGYEGGPWYRPADRPLERFVDGVGGDAQVRPLGAGEETVIGR
ncbi:MAG: MBL fold metallo-hydrolase [Solirubrobacterales bacterium]|nr:MBL fold metallo-hydrolase [Solirubrobacterales bacterium]